MEAPVGCRQGRPLRAATRCRSASLIRFNFLLERADRLLEQLDRDVGVSCRVVKLYSVEARAAFAEQAQYIPGFFKRPLRQRP